MQSRRDQVQAHTYLVGRLTSALVAADPDASETPLRRTTIGWLASVLIGILLVAAFAVFGLIFPGHNQTWRAAGVLIVEKETGTRYLYLGQRLRPVLNFASARLLIGGAPRVESVSRKSLAGVPHGLPVGLVGAPETLPVPSTVNKGAWLVCNHSGGADAKNAVSVRIGATSALTVVGEDQAVPVRTPAGDSHLTWRDRRLRLAAPWVADALGFGSARLPTVDPRWLGALAAGADLAATAVAGRGSPGPTLDGRPTRVGQVVTVTNTGTRQELYLVRPDGLEPLTQTEAALVLGDPATRAAYPGSPVAPVPASPAAVSSVRRGATPESRSAARPLAPPAPVLPATEQALCVHHKADGSRARVAFAPTSAGDPPPRSVEDSPGVTRDTRVADAVGVTAGGGALVLPLLAPATAGAAAYLVTDTGVKYPLPSPDAVAALGYRGVRPVLLPPALLALLPTGPALHLAKGR